MRVWLTLLLLVPLSGCFDFLEPPEDQEAMPADVMDDPTSYSVSGFRVWPEDPQDDLRVESSDGTELSVKVYEPLTRDARSDGSPIQFPVMIMLHPWGFAKEYFENAPMAEPSQDSPDVRVNLMQEFAEQGFITVAYDNRGFGRSDGEVGIAGVGEMMDLEAIRQWIGGGGPGSANFHVNGYYGVAGVSLGGGTALRGFVSNPEIDTVIDIYGWVDMYESIAPGNTPKAAWSAALFAQGEAASRGRLSSEVEEWLGKAVQRVDLTTVEAQMDTRSAAERLPLTDKPAFFCQGMQESLFPQIDKKWELADGFTRSFIFTGGHGVQDPRCWERALDWADYFLRGVDNDVPDWPFLETDDAQPEGPTLSFSEAALGRVTEETFYLHEGNLVAGPSKRTFTVQQRVLDNPFEEPPIVGDQTGYPQAVPEQLRQDPTAVFFDSGPLGETKMLLGAPTIGLNLTAAHAGADFQVVATLYMIKDGRSLELSQGAFSHHAGETHPIDREATLEMTWVKATVPADARLLLKLGANDAGEFLQFPSNFAVDFTGSSHISWKIAA